MILDRREFLKLLGISAYAVGTAGCDGEWSVPDRLVELALRGPGIESHKNTICRLCPAGCGLSVRLVDDLPVGLKGNPRHPLNRGGLCPVGQAGLEVLYSPQRVRGPLRRGVNGEHQPVAWEQASEEIAGRLAGLVKAGEGHRVAILSGEPGRLFEDLVARFAQTLGCPRLSHPTKTPALAHKLTQGVDEAPGYDLANSDLVLAFGIDIFEDGPSPIHAISAMVGSRTTTERCRLIHVGTRLSPSASKAEMRLPIRPNTHGALALGIGHVLVREGGYDRRFVEEHTFGFDDWVDEEGRQRPGFRRLLLERYYPDRVAQICGCEPSRVMEIAHRFARASAPIALAGGEAVSGSNGTWTGMAVHALNALTGAFDRPGGVVLPSPIPFTPLEQVSNPSLHSDRSVFAAAADGDDLVTDPIELLTKRVLDESFPLEVLILLNANPVYSSPLGERFRQAMERIPFVVALTSFRDESASLADFILPTHVFLESWHEATTPSTVAFSVLGLGQPVLEPLFDTRHPGDIILDLAQRVNESREPMPWHDYTAYLKHRLEGLVVSGQGTVFSGSFEEAWVQYLEERGWRFLEHAGLDQFWDDLVRESGWWNPVRHRGDWRRMFPTPSGRFEFFSQRLEDRLCALGGNPKKKTEEALNKGIAALGLSVPADEACFPHYEEPKAVGHGETTLVPFRPLTARSELTSVSPMVQEMFGYWMLSGWETWVELSPRTAHHFHIRDGDIVSVESDRGSFEAVARIQKGTMPGVVHVPIGLGHREFGQEEGSAGWNVHELLLTDRDPLAGNLCLTTTRVNLRLVRRRERGGPVPEDGGHA
jgi:anaerobic selenocysteine-containing dehydrogenase